MNGCVYKTADGQCEKFSDKTRNTRSWCVGDKPCEARTPTNADRIRAMSNEELAKYIDLHTAEAMWCNAPPDDCPPHETCELCILDWLKSAVEVDDG